MAENTEFDKDAIKTVGSELQSLMKDHQRAFDDLKAHWPHAGNFPTGVWLERLIDDRRNAVTQHGERFNMTLDQLGSDLRKIAEDFGNTDGENADKIAKVLDGGRGKNTDEVNDYSQATENDQGNVGEDDDSGRDQDGYDDAVYLTDSDDGDEGDGDEGDGDEDEGFAEWTARNR